MRIDFFRNLVEKFQARPTKKRWEDYLEYQISQMKMEIGELRSRQGIDAVTNGNRPELIEGEIYMRVSAFIKNNINGKGAAEVTRLISQAYSAQYKVDVTSTELDSVIANVAENHGTAGLTRLYQIACIYCPTLICYSYSEYLFTKYLGYKYL